MAVPVQNTFSALSADIAAIVDKVSGAVVAVQGGRQLTGSGIHWREGLVVTASHMVRSEGEYVILLPGRTTAAATLIGRDPTTDIAVLRVQGSPALPTVRTRLTEAVKVGHLVIGVGRSRLGDVAASCGMVARLGDGWKTWRGGKIDVLVRPDITLYPGQSGSALVNGEGELLGMNTNALARSATITVPTVTVERVVTELVEHGHIRRPYLGIAMQLVSLPDTVRAQFKTASGSGLLAVHVEPESPAGRSRVLLGDLIVGIGGKPVGSVSALQDALSELRSGQQVKLSLLRGGEPRDVEITIADWPERR